MDEALTEQYCHEVVGTLSFGTLRLLAQDAFRCHLTPRVNDILNRAKVDSVIYQKRVRVFDQGFQTPRNR